MTPLAHMLDTNSKEELDFKFLLVTITTKTIRLSKKARIPMGKAEIKILLPISKQMFCVFTLPTALRQRALSRMHCGKNRCLVNTWYFLLIMYLCLTQLSCMRTPLFSPEISITSWLRTREQSVQLALIDAPLIIRRDLWLKMFSVIVKLVFPETSKEVKDGRWSLMSPFHASSLFSPMSLKYWRK